MATTPLRSLPRQVKALVKKNLTLLVTRHWLSTFFQGVLFPIAIITLTLNLKNYLPKGEGYGIGTPTRIRPIQDTLPRTQELVFVRPPELHSEVDRVIDTMTEPISNDKVFKFSTSQEASSHCIVNFRGVSNCYAVITFHDTPLSNIYPNQTWNYTLRLDPIRGGGRINVHGEGDTERFFLPVQTALDNAITNSTETPEAYEFTTTTAEAIRLGQQAWYHNLVIKTYLIVFFLAVLPGIYLVVTTVTTDRETGVSQLVDGMGGSPAARVLGHLIAFSIVYLPTWIGTGILYWALLFPESNAAIPIFWQIFTGIAFLGAAIFAASFFTKRRISSVFVVICFTCLGGGAAILLNRRVDTARVISLSLLFPSMNFIFSLSQMARFARVSLPIAMNVGDVEGSMMWILEKYQNQGIPGQTYAVSLSVFWVLSIVQALFYPALAILAEKYVHGLNFTGRTLSREQKTDGTSSSSSGVAIRTTGLTKVYEKAWYMRLFRRSRTGEPEGFKALNGVDLVAQKHQILCLLGVNGAGKSTTLDLISGFHKPTSGEISINADHAELGLCPQKNVLFGKLTVLEHVKFWSEMKGGKETSQELLDLIEACGLTMKTHSRASTLSGGQKRKLQLACMFVGGTTVCLMDEVTSGLDPISRRTIWNIILAERSKRSMVFTTHFLDEGEVLADHIVILSKGEIKSQGSSTELKNSLGGGYRVLLAKEDDMPGIDAPRSIHQDHVVYTTQDSQSAAKLIAQLETAGRSDMQLAGPTIEDVFLRVAQDDVSDDTEELDDMAKVDSAAARAGASHGQLSSGKQTSFFQQVRILMMKRLRVLPRYWAAAFLALALPIACMPPINAFMSQDFSRSVCETNSDSFNSLYWPLMFSGPNNYYEYEDYANPGQTIGYESHGISMPFGPESKLDDLREVFRTHPIATRIDYFDVGSNQFVVTRYNMTMFDRDWTSMTDYDAFQKRIHTFATLGLQGGLYMGDNSHPPVLAINAEGINGRLNSMIFNNIYTSTRSGVKIAPSREDNFMSRGTADGGWQYILYAAFIFAVYPALFSLYPAFEKVSDVRALQFSNGVRPLPLWTAYFLFDLCFVLAVSIAYTITISQQFSAFWWNPAYMFPICLFYGIAAMLVSYAISTRASSQLASFLWTLGFNGLSFFVFALAYMLPALLSDPLDIQRNMDTISYTLGLVFPIAQLFRGMGLGLNLYDIGCRDDGTPVTPGSWYGFGYPITYLLLQIILLLVLLAWLDGDLFSAAMQLIRRARRRRSSSSKSTGATGGPVSSSSSSDDERNLPSSSSGGGNTSAGVEKETARVATAQKDLLRLVHVSKTFGNGTQKAVDDVSLGLGEGEILALLGPNGAGKTTIVNMIRGELRPTEGTVHLRDVDVTKHRRLAQRAIGVCPQFDSLDLLTARQHLEFYARIKGIDDVKGNVDNVMARVGLTAHAGKLASKLSGGNKRKLSLAIALMGNPSVLILDEPSSSMDAAAKRKMWRILAEIAPGRSLLLTTHSMEEADALATRAAILSTKLLAIGTTQRLRREYSNLYHVQLVLKSAPSSSVQEIQGVEEWVRREFKGDVVFEGPSLGGQVKFMVPPLKDGAEEERVVSSASSASTAVAGEDGNGEGVKPVGPRRRGGVGGLIDVLERNRESLGLQDYSVGAPTLEKVFLSVVKDNYVEENEEKEGGFSWRRLLGRRR